jgi:phage shock protein PspC (stress-responsive transcriptional regulator)
MEKVITIALNGNAFQLQEAGFDALRVYLDRAAVQLASNPDKGEIMRDLEQAIADKCARVLGPGKTVVSSAEIEQILRDVGPVDAGAGWASASSDDDSRTAAGKAPKRLYQIREGAMISGVANGIAAHFNLDPSLVRVAFAVFAVIEAIKTDDPPVLTVGLYVLLMFVLPYAKTTEERAAAQGAHTTIPYKVQRLVERVKAKFGEFSGITQEAKR